jgi:hypothetical protein
MISSAMESPIFWDIKPFIPLQVNLKKFLIKLHPLYGLIIISWDK